MPILSISSRWTSSSRRSYRPVVRDDSCAASCWAIFSLPPFLSNSDNPRRSIQTYRDAPNDRRYAAGEIPTMLPKCSRRTEPDPNPASAAMRSTERRVVSNRCCARRTLPLPSHWAGLIPTCSRNRLERVRVLIRACRAIIESERFCLRLRSIQSSSGPIDSAHSGDLCSNELRLASGALQRHYRGLRNPGSNRRAIIVTHDVQAQVHPRGGPSRGEYSAIVHIKHIGIHFGLLMTSCQLSLRPGTCPISLQGISSGLMSGPPPWAA
jgi:hypothetical protein